MSKLFCDNTRKTYLASCLYDCIEDTDIRAVRKLLVDNAADPNIIVPDRGITPFHLAVGNGAEKTAEEIIKLLLGFGGDPNVRSDDKLTPVHIAAAWGRFSILKLLLKCGGDATLIDDQNKCALDYAKDEEHFDIVDYLEQCSELHETKRGSVHYDLEKIIINNGVLLAEYVPNDPGQITTFDPDKVKAKLPAIAGDSYVNKWCSQLANITQINSDLVQQEDTHNLINDSKKKIIIRQTLRFDYSSSDENNLHQNLESPKKCCTNKLNNLTFENYKSHSNIINLDQNITRESSIVTILSDSSRNFPQHFVDKIYNYSPKKMLTSNFSNRSSSDFSNLEHNLTRESGIVTIPSDSSKSELDLNDCVIINDSSEKSYKTSSSEYLTCEDAKSINILDKNIARTEHMSELMTSDESDHITNVPCQLSEIEDAEAVFEVAEEYKYVDQEEDVILIEKHILVNPKIDDAISLASSQTEPSSKVSSLPSVINYDTDTLRKELTLRGEPPGPITKTTKRVYLKKLKKLIKHATEIVQVQNTPKRVYSVELEKTLRNRNWSSDLSIYKDLEQTVIDQFSSPDPTKRWREGVTKTSFTYLLLDPRITNNLPNRSDKLDVEEQWQTFLSAIFYVGKGKRSRPYSHLYEAVAYWQKSKRFNNNNNKKCEYILDIWKDQFGVVCLHIFQNIIPVEAYTREAAMIQAIKLQNLCNSKSGDFYGKSATWPERQKRQLGVFLLYRAMLIFLNEGERQLRPDDIEK